MMPRKKRIAIIVTAIILVVLIIIGILIFLFAKTDIFKSNETLFAKYLMQNIDVIEILKYEDKLDIKSKLNNNKYESKIEGKVQYTEDIGTSNENKNSDINKVGLKIDSKIDKQNNYNYKNISLETQEEQLVKFEYLKQDEIYGIRLNGIQQFVSTENDSQNNEVSKILKQFNIENLEEIIEKIDISSIFNFTIQEKETIINTYIGIIQANVSKDRYYKQSKSLITINNQDVQTNAYYIKFTIEEYNNLYIKILERIESDEIILSKIDLIESQIKEYINTQQNLSFREIFINAINNKIDEIQSNNIGNEEVKVTVYESNQKTVRTSIEKTTSKIVLDFYNNSAIKIDYVELGNDVNEQFIKIEKNNNVTQQNIIVEYEKIQDNEISNNIKLNYQHSFENNQITKNIELGLSNEKCEIILTLDNDISLVEEFKNEITLENDNVKLNGLSEERLEVINRILSENIQNQLSNLFSVVSSEEYTTIFRNLGLVKNTTLELPNQTEVTETERRRFNSQFEFFVSEDLTTDNIKDLMQIVENNFSDMKVLLKDERIQNLEMQKIEGNDREVSEYKESISEILLLIKEDSKNEQKKEDTLKFLEHNKNNKYSVSIQYNGDGLVQIIRVKIQEDD